MKRLEKSILNLIHTTIIDDDQNYWRYDIEEDSIHIFCSKLTTTLNIISILGDSGVTFSLSYVLDENKNIVIYADEPTEIDITEIPEKLLAFEYFN